VSSYSEDFTASNANWVNFNSSSFLVHSSVGGPDGGAYFSGTLNFLNRTIGSTPVVLRGRDDFDASGDAFVGDWATDGIRRVSAQVRHNAPQPLDYFFRASSLANFPGGFYGYVTVQPNTWTPIEFDVSPSSPQLVSFEGSDWGTIFSDVHNVLFGVVVPDSLVTVDTAYAFDLDKVSINLPEPASIVSAALAVGAAAVWPRRRFSRNDRAQG
jgi:hypothetical protein